MGLAMGWERVSACPAALCAGPVGRGMRSPGPVKDPRAFCPSKAQGRGARLATLEERAWERGACGAGLG